MNKIPKVSVIMTACNTEGTIEEAVSSVLDQSFKSFEIIIVDDGSTDNTLNVLNRLKDDRIRVIKRHHAGRVPSLNHALKKVRSGLMANLDADDICMPDRLEKQYDFFKKHPSLGLIGSYAIEVDEYNNTEKEIRLPTKNEAIRKSFAYCCPFIHSSVMYKKSVIDNIGFYDDRLPHSEDLDLWIRIASKYPVANLPTPLIKKRIHPRQSFKGVKEDERFKIESRLNMKAAFSLSLPLSLKIHSVIFFIYSRLPIQIRRISKSIISKKVLKLISNSRQGWEIR